MDNLQLIKITESDKWDSIVKSFNNYDVFYLSGYTKAFMLHGDGEPLLIYYNDGLTKAINVVMKRDIAKSEPFKGKLPLNTWFDLSTPYGYGGFLVEGENTKDVEDSYVDFCKEQGFVSEFVRFHLFNNYTSFFKGESDSHTRNVVRLLDISVDDMLMDFEHKVRKNLKKANNAGLEIAIDKTGKMLDEFLKIYYGTMDRNSAQSSFFFSEEFFQTIQTLDDNYVYFHVLYEGKVISTELVLYGTENSYSYLGGTNHDYFDLRPNDFLKFEIIKWAKEKGLKRFVLGGGYGEDDGIFKYKRSFAPNGLYDFYVGRRIFNEGKYNELLNIRGNLQSSSFFPLYRAI